MNPIYRLILSVVSSRAGGWYFVKLSPYIDRPLLRLTGGRVSTILGQPVLLLDTIGAKSGKKRSWPLVYAVDGENIILVASTGGFPKNPGWYYNLRAHPEVKILAGRRSGNYLAVETQGEERERLWQIAVGVYPGYATYQSRVERLIPVMLMKPIK